MPPFVPRKRQHGPEAEAGHSTAVTTSVISPNKRRKLPRPSKKQRANVFDAIDQPAQHLEKSVQEKRQLLERLHSKDEDEDEDDNDEGGSTRSSEAESLDFEDVAIHSDSRLASNSRAVTSTQKSRASSEDSDDQNNDFDWENAIPQQHDQTADQSQSIVGRQHEIGDISISVNDDNTYVEPTVSAGVIKKGPSRRERQFRINTHCLHVQCLMHHNSIRNSWLNDSEVHTILTQALTDGVRKEVLRWKEAMGQLSVEELAAKKAEVAAKNRGRRGRQNKQEKTGRDWAHRAQHLEQGTPDLSHGDPIFRLLKILTAYWRKRFLVTAPAIRKEGYKDARRLRDELRAWAKNKNAVDDYGERVEHIKDFRELARKCEGSRDVGAQLFVALLRGLGLQARLVANLQPIGFGWSKNEEALPRRPRNSAVVTKVNGQAISQPHPSPIQTKTAAKDAKRNDTLQKKISGPSTGHRGDPISLDDSESSLSSVPEDDNASDAKDSGDDASIQEIMPQIRQRRAVKKYDRDLAYPTYWAEVCSPISNKFVPVDAIVLSTVASNEELTQSLEPRGRKAEMSKQVICYTVAYNADGTAKDVTVRYIKRHQLPGKTKGVRIPAERIPVHNGKGKILRYHDYDWFKTVMLPYKRPKHSRTPADDLEEVTDLKPFKAATQANPAEKESLQWYKQSAEFVLEQHLRREEALLPNATPVRTFTAGKAGKEIEHPVYLRSDVVACKTVESWHKEGRALLPGQHPMKLVPMRAVTLIRKREIEDAQRETGEKLKQGLYSRDQTDWIIPDPIKDGVIPKNAFGNIDVYVPTMVPKGAVHLPLKGSARLCRKLEIDHAEACTGFEFGKQRAVPVLTGVVVAKEHAKLVRDAWRVDQAERKRKEDTKRTAVSLQWWRKMLLGLRVIERMRIEYRGVDLTEQEINPFVARAQRAGRSTGESKERAQDEAMDLGGGFLRDDEEEESDMGRRPEEDDMAGGFIVEDEHDDPDVDVESKRSNNLDATNVVDDGSLVPKSLHSTHQDDPKSMDLELQEASLAETIGHAFSSSASADEPLVNKTSIQLENNDHQSQQPPAARKRSSRISTVPKRGGRVTRGKSTRPKSTPTKSRYFSSQSEVPDELEPGTASVVASQQGEDDNASDSEAAEVTRPRRTTARTRSKQ